MPKVRSLSVGLGIRRWQSALVASIASISQAVRGGCERSSERPQCRSAHQLVHSDFHFHVDFREVERRTHLRRSASTANTSSTSLRRTVESDPPGKDKAAFFMLSRATLSSRAYTRQHSKLSTAQDKVRMTKSIELASLTTLPIAHHLPMDT